MTLRLFEGYGIELEYMIVDRQDLSARPFADRLLRDDTGAVVSDVEGEHIGWSNELVAHVIELKTAGPAPQLEPLPARFDADVQRINDLLAPHGAALLPTGMHPWFDPQRETVLWAHDNNEVYRQFDRIFGCKGHGWSNLQSMHLNLPFGDDAEFGRLHAAIRLLLPILPALAASSPLVEGRATGILDNRLAFYRTNSARIPSATGLVIPEPVFDEASYRREILERIWADTAPHDPQGILRHEWANARGAIARFDRRAIEIRVLDVQECPRADLAIAAAVVGVLKALVAERWAPLAAQQAFPVAPLHAIFLATMVSADDALIADREVLDLFGFPAAVRCTARELWQHLLEASSPHRSSVWDETLEVLLREGSLARRILRAIGGARDPARTLAVYAELARCLGTGRMFHGS